MCTVAIERVSEQKTTTYPALTKRHPSRCPESLRHCRIGCKRRASRLLASSKPYRAFESLSLSLRHAVRTAEKSGNVTQKYAKDAYLSRYLLENLDWRKCPTLRPRRVFWPVSLMGPFAVRFGRLQQGECNAITNLSRGGSQLTFVRQAGRSLDALLTGILLCFVILHTAAVGVRTFSQHP